MLKKLFEILGKNIQLILPRYLTLALVIALNVIVALAVAVIMAGSVDDLGPTVDSCVGGTGAVVVAVALAWVVTVAMVVDLMITEPVTVAIAAFMAGAGAVAGASTGAARIDWMQAMVVATAMTGSSVYGSWRSLKEDPKHALIRDIAIAFAAFKGTSFRRADLTDADFTSATLKSTDFRKAILTRTCFHKTKELDRVRPGSTYLKIAEIRQVLITGLGQDKKFNYQDLRGINLEGANLANASFLGANLKELLSKELT